MYKCKYFNIKELVSAKVYKFYTQQRGYLEDFIWGFFDEDILKDLDMIRESWGMPLVINNWASGGSLSQCGLRCNIDPLVKTKVNPYLSGHCLAKGFDLHTKQALNRDLHEHIQTLILAKKLKKFRRLENIQNTPTWVHVDALRTASGDLYIF